MKVKVLIVALTILFIIYLTLSTFTSSQRYLSPSEVVMGNYEGRYIAVMGEVAGTPRFEGLSLVFTVTDNQTGIIVRYQGPQVSLKEGVEVVVEGIYRGGELLASKILTKCPSRYGSLSHIDMNTIAIPLAISISVSAALIIAIIILERKGERQHIEATRNTSHLCRRCV
jgi:cytochrome c-type biogenesis protein CcmE